MGLAEAGVHEGLALEWSSTGRSSSPDVAMAAFPIRQDAMMERDSSALQAYRALRGLRPWRAMRRSYHTRGKMCSSLPASAIGHGMVA